MFDLDLEKASRTHHGPGLRTVLFSKQVWRFLFAVAFLLPAALFLAIPGVIIHNNLGSIHADLLAMLGFLLAGVVCIEIAMYFAGSWRRINQQVTAEEAMVGDPRPPILYLRPFKADRIRFSTLQSRAWRIKRVLDLARGPYFMIHVDPTSTPTGEELFVSLLDPLGPVVAVGKPRERVPPIGAARLYLGDDWRAVVQEYMKRSQLILLFAGTTPHFSWEIAEVFQARPFVPALLFLPFFRKYRQSEVDSFVELFRRETGMTLPSDLRRARAVFFPRSGEMMIFADRNDARERLLDSLNPFLGPVSRYMELTRPEWSAAYVESARENRRWAWRIIALFASYLAILIGFVICNHTVAS